MTNQQLTSVMVQVLDLFIESNERRARDFREALCWAGATGILNDSELREMCRVFIH